MARILLATKEAFQVSFYRGMMMCKISRILRCFMVLLLGTFAGLVLSLLNRGCSVTQQRCEKTPTFWAIDLMGLFRTFNI